MGNIASMNINLGRRADALAMQERVLEFRRRVLPENHPAIGEGHVRSDALHVDCDSRFYRHGIVQYKSELRISRCAATCVEVCA
jgi:hypothetical protein